MDSGQDENQVVARMRRGFVSEAQEVSLRALVHGQGRNCVESFHPTSGNLLLNQTSVEDDYPAHVKQVWDKQVHRKEGTVLGAVAFRIQWP